MQESNPNSKLASEIWDGLHHYYVNLQITEIGIFGGRYFQQIQKGSLVVFSLRLLIERVNTLIARFPKPSAENATRLNTIVDRICELDRLANEKLSKKNCLTRFLTFIRSFFGNRGFNKEFAIAQLRQHFTPSA
jgi:hypothetical protein